MEASPRVSETKWIREALEDYQLKLTRYALRITGDLEQARDAVQDTFLQLCREKRQRIEGHLGRWLFTVCRNRALDLRRSENRMTHLSEAAMNLSDSSQRSPEVHSEVTETTCRLLELIDELPANQQEVVRLRFQHELSYREIAGVTRLSVSNVGFLLHTALKTIRRRMRTKERPASRNLRRVR